MVSKPSLERKIAGILEVILMSNVQEKAYEYWKKTEELEKKKTPEQQTSLQKKYKKIHFKKKKRDKKIHFVAEINKMLGREHFWLWNGSYWKLKKLYEDIKKLHGKKS